jgi:hypothetical protein
VGGVVEVFVWINGQKRIEVVLRKRASALREAWGGPCEQHHPDCAFPQLAPELPFT